VDAHRGDRGRGRGLIAGMDPDDHVCLCFHVSLRKLRNYIARENPPVTSRIADCLGAGTGCRWCVPFLVKLHEQHRAGEPMDLPVAPAEYAARRARYRKTGERDATESDASGDATESSAAD
jgi:bacterioferritin-associated ferredoxin